MGTVMGKAYAVITRPIRNFNIENRAERIISKDKPVVAPMYKTDSLELDKLLRENPEIVERLAKKDPSFDARLKDVYVSTPDPSPPEIPLSARYNPTKPFPTARGIVEDFEYGIKEPEKTTKGRITLRHILKLLADHQVEPKTYTVPVLAKQYNLDENTVDTLLKFYGTFELYVPESVDNKIRFATPRHIPKLGEKISDADK